MNIALRISLLSMLGAATYCADASDRTTQYAYAWPLTVDSNSDSAAWQIELKAEIYAQIVDAQLRDVEVIDADGNAVPTQMLLPKPLALSLANSTQLPLFALPAVAPAPGRDDTLDLVIERGADGRLRRLDSGVTTKPVADASAPPDFIADASSITGPLDALRVDWTEGTSASARFDIGGSDDLQHWHLLAHDANVLDLHESGNHLARHDIPLDGARAAYLRLHRIDSGAALPQLRVTLRSRVASSRDDVAAQWLDATLMPAMPAMPAIAVTNSASTNQDARVDYRYALPGPIAVNAFKLELGADNSVAGIELQTRPADTYAGWTSRADFTAFRLRQGNALIDNDATSLGAATRDIQWRIRSTLTLNPPPTLKLAWRADRFVFLAQGRGPYRLVAGSATARRGDYPIDAVLMTLRGKFGADWQPPLVTVGSMTTLQGASARSIPPAAPAHFDWKTWSLWAVLIGASALIGYLALSLVRKPPAPRV